MPGKFIDLSITLENNVPSDPPGYDFAIEYTDHQQNIPVLERRYGGQLDVADLPGGEAFALEKVRLSTHNGTHVDSPWHYASTMEDGSPAPGIDEIPLDWFMGRGVRLDFRRFEPGFIVTAQDVEDELARIGHELQPRDIVLVNTAAGARWGHSDFIYTGCGMGREATHYLTDRGVRVAGTDAWSWDVPHKFAIARFAEDRDPAKVLEGHKAGRKHLFCHMEKLHNLEALPNTGYQVFCFPVKIKGASAGWTRCVALLDD